MDGRGTFRARNQVMQFVDYVYISSTLIWDKKKLKKNKKKNRKLSDQYIVIFSFRLHL